MSVKQKKGCSRGKGGMKFKPAFQVLYQNFSHICARFLNKQSLLFELPYVEFIDKSLKLKIKSKLRRIKALPNAKQLIETIQCR